MNYSTIAAAFEHRTGAKPLHVVRAPGRVNLIGEHTDYNGGFVLPMAIDRATWIALRPRSDYKVSLYSLDKNESVVFDTYTILQQTCKAAGWSEYVRGVTWALAAAGHSLHGWEGVMGCDVPMGAGLSSSASLELAVARAFAIASGFPWEPLQMALLSQRAENKWVGVNCGLMDQMISAVGQSGYAVLINCNTLSHQPVSLPEDVSIVVMDTSTRRGLVDSAYNERRASCERAAAYFGAAHLCDVPLNEFTARALELDETTRRRTRHVLTENSRTLEAVAAMDRGDAVQLGRLLNASHESLRADFEVSCPELDAIVQSAREAPGCFGARMTGAGFGGCGVAIVHREATPQFVREVRKSYRSRTNMDAVLYVCQAAAGASEEIQ